MDKTTVYDYLNISRYYASRTLRQKSLKYHIEKGINKGIDKLTEYLNKKYGVDEDIFKEYLHEILDKDDIFKLIIENNLIETYLKKHNLNKELGYLILE